MLLLLGPQCSSNLYRLKNTPWVEQRLWKGHTFAFVHQGWIGGVFDLAGAGLDVSAPKPTRGCAECGMVCRLRVSGAQ